jgi:hypothetical protein
MTTGLILLVFIAVLVTYFVVRPFRRRAGMGATPLATWIISIAALVLGILLFYVYQAHG